MPVRKKKKPQQLLGNEGQTRGLAGLLQWTEQ